MVAWSRSLAPASQSIAFYKAVSVLLPFLSPDLQDSSKLKEIIGFKTCAAAKTSKISEKKKAKINQTKIKRVTGYKIGFS